MNRPRRMDVPPVQHLRTLTAGQARRTALLRAAPGTGCSRPERVQGPNAFRKEMAPHEPYPGTGISLLEMSWCAKTGETPVLVHQVSLS